MTSPNSTAEVLDAISASTGSVLWTHTFSSGCCKNTMPAIAQGVVYLATAANNSLSAFKAKTGKQLWTVPANGQSPAAVANGVVYEQSEGGGPTAYSAATGAQLWTDTSRQGPAGVEASLNENAAVDPLTGRPSTPGFEVSHPSKMRCARVG